MPPLKSAASASRQVISRQLRQVILDSGLTAYTLGKEAQIDPGMIQRFLNEERDIRLDTLDRLADVLGLRLVEGARSRTRSPRRESQRAPRRQRETVPAREIQLDATDSITTQDDQS